MILFSYDIFSAQSTGGVSRCMIELMRALAATPVDWRLWAGSHSNALLGAAVDDAALGNRVLDARRVPHSGRFSGTARNERRFAAAARSVGAQVLHRSFYPVVDLATAGTVRIETLHDMWDERAGGSRDRLSGLKSVLKRRALHRADVIVCVSHSTRRELIDLWPALEPRAVVIHHGVRPLSAAPEAVVRPRPFFLFVGQRGSYKNFDVALAALRAPDLPDHDLVCFGGGRFRGAELAAIGAAGLEGRVVQVGGGDDQLAGHYQAATALLYPSAYEGFGLPVLEAMIHDCPVVAAPLTSLPEVGGDAAVYADPARPDEWSHAMIALANDPRHAADVRAGGRLRAADFSWAAAAKGYASVYRGAMK